MIAILLGSFLFSLSYGTLNLSLNEVLGTLMGSGSNISNFTVLHVRLPRIVAASIVAIALSTSSVLLQSVTRNELADSGIIGINSGAALAVVIYICGSGKNYTDDLGPFAPYVIPFIALLGAIVTGIIVYALSYKNGVNPIRLVLTGIGINAGLAALITYFQLTASRGDYNQVLTWTNGSLWGSNWKYIRIAAPIILILVLICIWKSKSIDLLDLGDGVSIGLGLQPEKERRSLLIISVMLAGTATAIAGNISFLGLLSSHIAKRICGPKHMCQIPLAAIISSIIVILADAFSRNLFSPLEIPVGITISLIGVPYFIYLMLKEK